AEHQYSGVYGGRSAAAEWRKLPERTAKEFFVHGEDADWSDWRDHAVEFPALHSGVESCAGAGGGKHVRVEAGGTDAAVRDSHDGDSRAGGAAGGRAESGVG